MMPDALSVGGPFVLYKPEGAANYFFFDFTTGTRVYGADLERAKLVAEANGLKVEGQNFNGGAVFVRDGEVNAWQALHPDAPVKSMPDPGHFQKQFPPETLAEPSKPPLPEPTAIDKEIEQARQAVDRWDRYGAQISRVRQLEKGTMYVPEEARNTGYNSLDAVRGYRQLVVAYPVVENVSEPQRQGLKRLAGVLERLENDELSLGDRPSADTIKNFLDGKMKTLEKEGEIFMVTGHSHHFNITRIRKMPDGSYTSTLYDAGGETKILGTENGRKIAAAVQESKIKPGTDIRDMIETNLIKKDARAEVYIEETKDYLPASDEYTNARKKLEAMVEDKPLRIEPELAQRRGNCTTRGQRIMANDILNDDKLSEGLYDFASNMEGTTGQDVRKALQRKVEYLEAIRDGADPQNAWRQLDVDNYAKASDAKTYEVKSIELDGGGAMEVYRTKPGAFNVNELDNLQGTLKRNGVDAVVRPSVKNPNEYYLYVPKEDAPKIAEALKNDHSPAADLFRQYGPKAKDHIEVRNFMKASDAANYDTARISAGGNKTIDVYRTKPGLFNEAELNSLRGTLQRNGVNAVIRESTKQPGEHYLYVPKEDAPKIQAALSKDKSPAADLYRRHGAKAPEMVDGYAPPPETAPKNTGAATAVEDATKTSRFLKEGEELGRTARVVQKLGAAEEAVAATNTAMKALGTAAKGGMAVVGIVGADFAIRERVNGTGYTRLLEANGLDDNSSAVFGYKTYQEGNIGDSVLMAIPTGATQALGMISSGVRYMVGDVDHGKLLATIVAKDPNTGVPANGRSKEEIDKGLRNAVTQYVDSAVWYYHHLNANQRRNIIDNVLAMKESGKLKDWSQLPALVGNSKNITYLWNDPKGPYTQSGLNYLKLPDAEKTKAAMEKEMGGQLANAMEIESKRLEAKMPDIDWVEARERLQKSGMEAAKKFIDGEMSVKMPGWKDVKEGFFKALEIFDADLTIQKTRNLFNRPLDSLSQAFLDMTTGTNTPDGKPADLSKPMVLDENGNYRTLTDDDIKRIKEAKPDDPDSPHIRYLKTKKDKDGKSVIVETDLTKEELDAIQSGRTKIPSAADLIKDYQKGATPDLSFKFPDATTLEQLQEKMTQIEGAKDPAAKEKAQNEFNQLFIDATPETRKKFIDSEKTEEQNAIVEKFIDAQKEKTAQAKKDGKGEEFYGLGGSELEEVLKSNAEKAGVVRMYQTGLTQNDYNTAEGRVSVHQKSFVADLNNDGVFGADDKAFLEKYGMAEFSVTTRGDKDTVNRVNSKMFGAFEFRDGAYVPIANTPEALIAEMKKNGADLTGRVPVVDIPEPPPPPMVLKAPKT